jgi:PAS domain S-box-containing protein
VRGYLALAVLALLFGAAWFLGGKPESLWIVIGGVVAILLTAMLGIEPILGRLRRAQEVARDGEAHMRAILDAAAEGILTVDQDGVIVTINTAAESMFGYLPHEAVGFGVQLLVADVDVRAERDSTARTHTRAAAGRRRDGGEFPVQIGIATTRVGGRTLHVLTVQDGSIQAAAEKAIRESELRTAAILSAAADPFVIIDGDGRILDFNPAAERTFGWERRQVLDKEFADVLITHPRRMSIRRGLREAASAQNTSATSILNQRIELAARKKDGREVTVELVIMPVDLASGRQFAARLRDLSGRDSERDPSEFVPVDEGGRAQAIVESAALAVLTIDDAGRVESINPACEKLFGWGRKELCGADVVRLIPADQGDRREALFEDARKLSRLGAGAHADLEGVRRDGTRFPMRVSASRVRVGDRVLFVWVVHEGAPVAAASDDNHTPPAVHTEGNGSVAHDRERVRETRTELH